ncbi:hypothetical protein CDD80_804 [Ophiocordyceps camponoti-rufipedis]|uniref:AB hydrolase-1 domain-containing protein n=1 Tax=Ophiocordyceps camponoti-rufipedis TaxID=2004952 RepID=A0A2C5YKN8_9HYPO|nr:hypothetical protein CDD80_804 [Ophiocordyceps camponoti-rufipedis]
MPPKKETGATPPSSEKAKETPSKPGPPPALPRPAVPRPAVPRPAVPQAAQPQAAHKQPAQKQTAHPQPNIPQAANTQGAIHQSGFHQTGFHQTGSHQTGFHQTGFHQAGFPQPVGGAFTTRTVHFVKAHWPATETTEARPGGHMYVEQLDPLMTVQPMSIILIHGDWHTGQIWTTKPDGKPGWASYLVYQGHRVYIVDLPACGRSNSLTGSQVHVANQSPVPSSALVSRDVTNTAGQMQPGWDTATFHTQWPGSGQAGDAVFDRYYSSLVPLLLRKVDRQKLAQTALAALLDKTGPAILLGEGSGATMAWLAADLKPEKVAAVIAVEPAGPPCGTARNQQRTSPPPPGPHDLLHSRYSSHIRFDPSVRGWGIADIPIKFDPPVEPGQSLNVITALSLGNHGTCVMQQSSENMFPRPREGRSTTPPVPRKLINLTRMQHLVVTAAASSHSTYDWATVEFLKQAGVDVEHRRLEEYGIVGNGHLMFLEQNSDEVVCLISMWISARFPLLPTPIIS